MKITVQTQLPDDLFQYIVFAAKEAPIQLPHAELQQAAQDAQTGDWFTGALDSIVPIVHGARLAVLVGLGENPADLSQRKWSQLMKQALAASPLDADKQVGVITPTEEDAALRGMVDGALLGHYAWNKYRSEAKPSAPQAVCIQSAREAQINRWTAVAEGVNFARDLANENADVAHAQFLAETMRSLAEGDPRCHIEILGQSELEERGLHLHLAVNQGSHKEPRLVIVHYNPQKTEHPEVALVGKGITFDTGGLNLKPTGGIESMRMDMGGAAAVIGTLRNTLALNLETHALFVCGFAENAIGVGAYKPGDVVASYAGKSVEIGNTDAEGRLVLADAMAYVIDHYQPEAVVDIATLTGAVVMALGYEYSGLMSSDQALGDALLKAGQRTDDRAWQLPIYPELREHVKSSIADIKNTGIPRAAGSLSAAEFLRQFAQHKNPAQKWAHLDIAGAAKPKSEVAIFPANQATGAGVRLLTEFLAQPSPVN